MKHRSLIFCIIAVLALGLMGFGYAAWASNATTTASVTTGTFQFGIAIDPTLPVDIPAGTADRVHNGSGSNTNGDIVGSLVALDSGSPLTYTTDGTYYGSVTETYTNVYPDYDNGYTVDINNGGSIPIDMQAPTISWTSGSDSTVETDYNIYSYTLTDTIASGTSGTVNAPITNAGPFSVTGSGAGSGSAALASALTNYQLLPGHTLKVTVEAFMDDASLDGGVPLAMGASGTQTIAIRGTQFNY
jgi:hypothetical protein